MPSPILSDTLADGQQVNGARWNSIYKWVSGKVANHFGLGHNNAPPNSEALGAALSALNSRVMVSLNGAARVGAQQAISRVINPMDFGCKWDGVTVDDAGLADAIDAWLQSSSLGGMLWLPPGAVKITTPLLLSGVIGGTIRGAGRTATKIIWGGDPGADVLVVNASQRTTIEGFSVHIPTGRTARRGIAYDYATLPPPVAATGNTMRDVSVTSDVVEACEDALWFSDAYGNNSEFVAEACTFEGYSFAGIHLPNTQSKSMNFIGCQASGGWDGVTGHAGGQYGVTTKYIPGPAAAGGGSFQWLLGGVGSCRKSAFQIAQGNDPFMIWGVQSENCYRFFEVGDDTDAPNAGYMCVSLQLNRIDSIFDHAEDVVRFNGAGNFDCRFNQFNCSSVAPLSKVKILSGTQAVSAVVRNNMFQSINSVSEPGVIFGGSFPSTADIGDNLFVDSGQAASPRVEAFDVGGYTSFTLPTGVSMGRARYPAAGPVSPTLRIDFGALSVASTSKNLKIYEIPRGFGIRSIDAYLFDRIRGGSVSALTLQFGNASADDGFLLAFDAWSLNQQWVGNATAQLGAHMTTGFAQGRYLGSYTAPTEIWLRAVATGDNLDQLTSGYVFLILNLVEVPRFVLGA